MTTTAQAARPRGATRRLSPRFLRDLHLYFAVFFSPVIFFFALTGVVQVLGLHEASRDGTYKPAPFVEKLSQVHIHQRFAEPPRRAAPKADKAAVQAAPPAAAKAPARPKSPGVQLVKWFFAAAGFGLMASAALGIWIGVTQSRQRRLAWGLVAAGALIPVALLVL